MSCMLNIGKFFISSLSTEILVYIYLLDMRVVIMNTWMLLVSLCFEKWNYNVIVFFLLQIQKLLEVIGSAVYCQYGQQVQKLLYLIFKEHFPKTEQVLLLGKRFLSHWVWKGGWLAGKSLARSSLPLRNDGVSSWCKYRHIFNIMLLSFGSVLQS